MTEKKSTENQEAPNGSETFTNWFQTATTYWQALAQQQTEMFNQAFKETAAPKSSFKEQADKAWQTGTSWMKLAQSLMQPESKLFSAGGEVLPGMLMEFARQTWESALQMQQEAMQQATVFQASATGTAPFQHLNQNLFTTLRGIYEKELQKFYQIPQLGLSRAYQAHWNDFADKSNLYQTATGEFIHVLAEPLRKSTEAMQAKVNEMIEGEGLPEDPEKLYGMWIKHLEGQYMTLLQSPEYLKTLNTLLTKMTSLIQARDQIWYDLLQHVPVPTNEDMNDLYKELYLLKKRVRELETQLETQKQEQS